MGDQDSNKDSAFQELDDVEEGGIGTMIVNVYYALINLAITLGAVAIMMVAFWLFKWANCADCCCNSCNRGSSYCAFPRFSGEDIGDETRNYIFWMCVVGFFCFALSYSIWANYGSPRIFLLIPSLSAVSWLGYSGLHMQWLMCHPVEKPTNNLSNWISMDALATEHGRVALFTIACYAALLCFDICICFVCCCCIEEMEDSDAVPPKEKAE